MSFIVFYNGNHTQDGPNTRQLNSDYDFIIIVLILSFICATFCFIVVCSVLCSGKTRVDGFNLYLVFLLVPDVCQSIMQIIVRSVSLKNNIYYVKNQCIIGCFIMNAYIGSNLWMNVLVAHEIFIMLKHTNQGKRFKPSSPKVVLCRVSIVYSLSIVMAILLTFNTKPLLDTRIDSEHCNPRFYGVRTIVCGYFLVGLAYCSPPMYLIYITFVVYKKNLLPPTGKSRFLALYFLRITIVAIIFTIIAILTSLDDIAEGLIILVALQGIFVSLMSVAKNDIYDAVMGAFCCLEK